MTKYASLPQLTLLKLSIAFKSAGYWCQLDPLLAVMVTTSSLKLCRLAHSLKSLEFPRPIVFLFLIPLF